MSIHFACPRCGRPFTLDDRFAGKKGRCKDCGSIMPIPAPPSPARAGGRETSPSRRASRAAADVYGFDDEPLPPRSPTPAYDQEVLDAPDTRTPLYPRRAGFYPEPSRSPSSTGGGRAAFKIILRVVIGITGGLGGLVGAAVGIPGLRSMVTPGGWSSRSQIEAFVKRQVDLTDELTGILRAVTDVPSASARSAIANATVRKMTDNLRSNKDRRGNQKDIEEIKRKYTFDQQQALRAFTGEVQRVAMVPGALDALAIQDSFAELAAIEQTIPGLDQQAGFNPPSDPLANFQSSPAPTLRPLQLPGLNRPAPGPGPQVPDFRPPGMPPRPNLPGPRGPVRGSGNNPF